MRYKPVHTNILAEIIEQDKEESTIIAPQDNSIIRAKVIEIGDGNLANGNTTPMLVHPHMTIWFERIEATQIPFNKNWFLIEQDYILLIEED